MSGVIGPVKRATASRLVKAEIFMPAPTASLGGSGRTGMAAVAADNAPAAKVGTMSSAGSKLEKQDFADSQPKLRALLVEDNALDAELVVRALYQDGFDVIADVVQDEACIRAGGPHSSAGDCAGRLQPAELERDGSAEGAAP